MAEIQKLDLDKAVENNHGFPKELSLLEEILFLLAKIAAIILAFLLVFLFLFGLCRNSDASMGPSVKDGDLVMFYRLDKSYIARDALVLEFDGHKQVRRVVGPAGGTIGIAENGLVINGAYQQEQEIYSATQRYENGPEFPITVGEGEVFVLGDSRVNATDSRFYGVVKVKDTLGKVMMVLRWRNI